MPSPFVSIIIVNYNGAHYLPDCLEALRTQTYPPDCRQVIVSDNGSTDGSLELLRASYPEVRVLENKRNLGFASGNNVAISQALGQYVVLLNNDTAAAPNWLENLVAVAEKEGRCGIVTGRLQLFYDQLELVLESETVVPSEDRRVLGIQVCGVEGDAPGGVIQYLDGFYEPEVFGSTHYRWTKERAVLGIPVPRGIGKWQVRFQLAASRPDDGKATVKVTISGDVVAEWLVSGSIPKEYVIEMSESIRSAARPLVQNAGSIIFRNGSGRDRGTFVGRAQVFYEVDKNQYDRVEEVFAGCGANMLIRRSMADDVGLLDDDFFMYYEDTDLSWRARLMAWKILYAPQAIVRHIHCGTAVEWSPSFVYYTDRNRLAMLFKNAKPSQIFRAWSNHLGKTIQMSLAACLAFSRRRMDWRVQVRRALVHYRVLFTLMVWLPALSRKRWSIQRRKRIATSDIEKWFVD